MRNFSSDYDINYNILAEDYEVLECLENESCYGELYSLIEFCTDSTYIELLDVECKETISYWKFYCDYIGKILKLNYKITNNSFIFEILDEYKLNILVCTLIRYLWEISEDSADEEASINEHLTFFESLYNDKDNLKYNLEEFCLYYKKAGFENTSSGHQICDSKYIKLKTYDELIEAFDKTMFPYGFINQFFTKENKKDE